MRLHGSKISPNYTACLVLVVEIRQLSESSIFIKKINYRHDDGLDTTYTIRDKMNYNIKEVLRKIKQ